MSPELLDIERKAFRLPVEERELLAERLIQSLDNVPLTEVEESWIEEAERRFTVWRCGHRKGVSAKQPSDRSERTSTGEVDF